ncbi:MAG: hypothetical protein EPN17_01010 [Methylobacter sp.]|nr:MAG: hypothetical protein EPN17_01010 [Methylobacter sp.]
MATSVLSTLNFENSARIINLPNGINPQEPATVAQLDSAIEGLAWKTNSRVSTQGNIDLATPGAAIDGITLVSGDRVLVRAQTVGAANGIYIWNGAAIAMTRSLDCSTAAELKQAITTIEEGTNGGTSYRQTVVGATLETTDLIWTTFGTGVGAASETSPGVAELATQAETDAGADDSRVVTPLKLASSVFASRKHNAIIGDGAATSYTVTHNFNTRDVEVEVYRNSGNYDTVLVNVQRTSVNAITLLFDVAPTSNAFRVMIKA